jgi:hypothetical protein
MAPISTPVIAISQKIFFISYFIVLILPFSFLRGKYTPKKQMAHSILHHLQYFLY